MFQLEPGEIKIELIRLPLAFLVGFDLRVKIANDFAKEFERRQRRRTARRRQGATRLTILKQSQRVETVFFSRPASAERLKIDVISGVGGLLAEKPANCADTRKNAADTSKQAHYRALR
ncbi:hypothetical protein U713_01405 [Rhodobacter capsulatus YW2]|nr:hypothetical protein U713_01405 [Rhodobacter capsulatus YW2]